MSNCICYKLPTIHFLKNCSLMHFYEVIEENQDCLKNKHCIVISQESMLSEDSDDSAPRDWLNMRSTWCSGTNCLHSRLHSSVTERVCNSQCLASIQMADLLLDLRLTMQFKLCSGRHGLYPYRWCRCVNTLVWLA